MHHILIELYVSAPLLFNILARDQSAAFTLISMFPKKNGVGSVARPEISSCAFCSASLLAFTLLSSSRTPYKRREIQNLKGKGKGKQSIPAMKRLVAFTAPWTLARIFAICGTRKRGCESTTATMSCGEQRTGCCSDSKDSLRFCEKRDARDWIYGVRERERERETI